jgi:cyanophycin synthetase
MADLAGRLDVQGRRIVVLAGPGDRRDEDLRAIAEAVAGRFDHYNCRRDVDIMEIGHAAAGHFDTYICRRDDHRRGRDGDEIPGMLRKALMEKGVPDASILVIPDEVEAIDRALQLGREGDLVLIFADALTRSWKQILHFVPEAEGAGPRVSAASATPASARASNGVAPDKPSSPPATPAFESPAYDGDLLVRDERGVRLARESDD